MSGGLDVGSTWVGRLEFTARVTGGQKRIWQCVKVRPSGLIIIWRGWGLKVSFFHYVIQLERMLDIMMGYYTCVKCKNHGTLTYLNNLIHHGLMYWNKVWWGYSTSMQITIGRKPHPFSNERHVIGFGLMSIL